MVYEWKDGSRISADADKVGNEIASLGQEVDALTVVNAARRKDSAMHDCFEWDDSEAADLYRMDQARAILRSLVVIVKREDAPDGQIMIRAYEHVDLGTESENRTAYVPTRKALKRPELRAQILSRLDSTIREAKQTADNYKYLCSGLEEVSKRLSSAREAIPV